MIGWLGDKLRQHKVSTWVLAPFPQGESWGLKWKFNVLVLELLTCRAAVPALSSHGVWMGGSPFRSQCLASNQQFLGETPASWLRLPTIYTWYSCDLPTSPSSQSELPHKELTTHAVRPQHLPLWFRINHIHAYESFTHTYSVFMLTSAWRQYLAYLMWQPCLSLQTCSLRLTCLSVS